MNRPNIVLIMADELRNDPGERHNRYGDPRLVAIERDLLRHLAQVHATHGRDGLNPGHNGFFG